MVIAARYPAARSRVDRGFVPQAVTGDTVLMATLSYSESIVIARSPEARCDLVSDAGATGIPVTLAAIKRTAESQ
jgi:hypothetical protein